MSMKTPGYAEYCNAVTVARQIRDAAMKSARERYAEIMTRSRGAASARRHSIDTMMDADERYANATWAAHTVYRQALQEARKVYESSKETA